MSKFSGFHFLCGKNNLSFDSMNACLYRRKNNEIISYGEEAKDEIINGIRCQEGEIRLSLDCHWLYASFEFNFSSERMSRSLYAMFKNNGSSEGTFLGFTDEPIRMIKVHELWLQYQSAVQERDEQVRDLNQAVDQLGSMFDWI